MKTKDAIILALIALAGALAIKLSQARQFGYGPRDWAIHRAMTGR